MQNYGYPPHPYNTGTGARPTINSPPMTNPLPKPDPNIPNNMITPSAGSIPTKYALQHQNPNSTVDPIYHHQQYSNPPPVYFPKPYAPKLMKGLTFEEGERLLQVWRHNNFADFNSWVQVAKAQVSIDISETSNDMVHKGEKLYNCNLILTFEEDKSYSLKAHGFGKSKKDAKRMAIEGIVADLIQSGEIKRGLKNKDFLLPGYNNMKPGTDLEEGPYDQLQKKIHRMAKKMHDYLKKEDFVSAFEILYKIILKKKPDWNEISFIWCYALLKRNVAYLKSIIDLIQYRKLLDEEVANTSQASLEPRAEAEELIRRELLERYGNARLKNDNVYEQYDAFNVESNSLGLSFSNAKEITEEEATAEILRFPLNRDLNYVLQQEKEATNPIQPPPTINIRPPLSFSTHPPPPTSNSIQQQLSQLVTKQPPAPQSMATTIPYGISVQPAGNKDSSGWTLSHQPVSLVKPEKPAEPLARISQGASHLEPPKTGNTNSDASQQLPGSQAELGFTRELKNPEINYLPYKLLDEFYESLLYVGDLNFATNMSEVLYSKVKLDDEDFISNSACQYYAHKKNMLMIELLENIFQPISRSKNRIMEYLVSLDGVLERIGNKYAQEVVEFSPVEPIENVKTKISKSKLTEWNDVHAQISEGEFVMLISLSQPLPGRPRGPLQQETTAIVEVAMIACVKEVSRDYRIKLFVLPTKEQSDTISEYGRTWKITKLTNQTATEKTCEALEIFTTRISMLKPLTQILLMPPNCNPNTIKQLAETNAQLPFKAHPPFQTCLNVSQKKALQLATSQLLTLIQGPPGSGKTITAIEIVLEWLRQSSLHVLVCAESISKVDEIHSEFEKIGVRSVKVSFLSEDEEPFNSNKQSFSPPNFQNDNLFRAIQRAQVVCATCIGCASDYIKDITFARILIMEACSLVETACLIPVIKGCQQLVLVGDHKGLSPQVNSVWAQSKGMSVSLFERLVKQGVQPQFLNIQYRIHHSLAAFPNQYFYNNALETGVGENQRPMILGFNWPNPAVRVALIGVKGEEKIYSSSILNTKEIEVVIEVLMHILKSGYHQLNNIGILASYEGQKNRLKNEINIQAKKFPQIFGLTSEQAYLVNKNSNLIDIEVVNPSAKIEDKDLIIFSSVRSNKDKLGFLKDPRRMNYVLTKAKRGLIVIGNIETLNQDKNWREWIKWCRSNKVVLHYT